ncbi:riboflavin biosynthesis protein RibD [Bacillus thuringiensis]|uniref:bifunctional diaminohydroxyphosphoribosylaminopyrimidine deaminase/5-amino-6-(5-phosphoribosylamino)uracil reductase RibD n=1 Tax=Bacillus thuringiensis TaxID=1428 RepID=UPI000C9EB93E|nr:bifunctional diaminohydroxyphosphoribosylaminopyrimidine deaminase/5-amino-6-(5-phosphoribosylamino)uracil reductase RibD [Bacillus thuringiensis]PNK23174.1 riboflavin biosynthesis protein RibD [Bacillus thuringiensis]PNK47623.1 riboflavin biosynthesis protein RibD [Bacillus thuringiensis]
MDHEYYMDLALQLAKYTDGQTTPNPKVGAVVVNNGRVVGVGAHICSGTPHAEVHALNMAGNQAKGATLYVTLEPCNHFGKTPPCTDKIINSKVSRVVIGCVDPNPNVNFRGINYLKENGIDVIIGIKEEECIQLNKIFFHYITSNKPYVTVKVAMSLDGKVATCTGDSKWITDERSRKDTHAYRAKNDAILVGVNTIIQDNPHLTTRLPLTNKSPIRIILDTNLRIPINANILHEKTAETWIVTGNKVDKLRKEMLLKNNVQIIELNSDKIQLPEVLKLLGNKGISSLLVEGGSKISGEFIKSRLVNEIIIYMAPKIIGGTGSFSAFNFEGVLNIMDAPQYSIVSVEKLNNDVKIVAKNFIDQL